jgi:hypothetical protein
MALTYSDYTASGSATTFAIPFDRISDSHVKVYSNYVLQTNGYSVVGNNVVFSSAPTAGTIIRVRRISDATERVVDYVDGSRLSETDLDSDSKQAFYLIQEGRDINEDSLVKNSEDNWEATGDKIINVGYPVSNADAATKSYVDATANNFANYGALNPFTRWAFTGNGTALAFPITGATLLTEEAYLVHINGTAIDPASYTVTADTITFGSAVVNEGKGVVVNLGYPKTDGNLAISTGFIANGAVTPAKLSTGAPTWTTGGNVSATTFTGALVGNATTATTAVTATNIANGAVNTPNKIFNGVVTAEKLGTNEKKQICKAWVNFNGGLTDYTTGNTVSYSVLVGGGATTVTITRASHDITVGTYVTISGITGITGVSLNGVFFVTQVTSTTFVYDVVGAAVGTPTGTAVVRRAFINSHYNVSGIEKTSNGDYSVYFSIPMLDNLYSVLVTSGTTAIQSLVAPTNLYTTSFRFAVTNTGGTGQTPTINCAAVFGNSP